MLIKSATRDNVVNFDLEVYEIQSRVERFSSVQFADRASLQLANHELVQ